METTNTITSTLPTMQLADSPRAGAFRVRACSLDAAEALRLAVDRGHPVIRVAHGGTVCNSYKWRADTEVCGVVAFPDGRVYRSYGRIPANKATLRGAAMALWGEGAPWDGRCGSERQLAGRRAIIAMFDALK